MVELQHRAEEPTELAAFLIQQTNPSPRDFDSLPFKSAKSACKTALSQDQGGLCAYCETMLAPSEGSIDYIKPKGKPEFAHLCFTYTNYAHSCCNKDTCNAKKADNLLPIEPGPNCNDDWQLSSDGSLEPLNGLTRNRRHKVEQTRDMLGLNIAALVQARQKAISQYLLILQDTAVADPLAFLQTQAFRYLLARI